MKIIFFVFIFISKITCAQFYDAEKAVPSAFDKFIVNKNIEWAAYINDTIRFTKINLSELLRKRFIANEIKVAAPGSLQNLDEKNVHYLSRNEIDRIGSGESPSADEVNVEAENNPAPKHFDRVEDILDVSQLFYIEDGKLKNYIPVVAPKQAIITSSGLYLGQADYFITAFNFNYKHTHSRRDKIISLQQTNLMLEVDSIEKPFGSHVLKQLYNRNLVETLWPYIINGTLKAFSSKTDKPLSMDELDQQFHTGNHSVTASYDSSGNPTEQKDYYGKPLSPGFFKQVEIKQQWYYNEIKNIVFSTIEALIFYAGPVANTTVDKDSVPALKIVFN